jgi:hypothetical protein
MSKMGSPHPFGHLKYKLRSKERSGVEWVVWLPTTKSRESTRFTCLQVAWDTLLESSWQGLQLFSNLILIRGLHVKLWGPKVAKIPTLTKYHLDVGLMERHKVYYKGEGDGFPQVWAMVSLVSPSCLWLVLTRKVLQLCTNHFVLVLCKSMWVVEAC